MPQIFSITDMHPDQEPDLSWERSVCKPLKVCIISYKHIRFGI